jgi:hypothetical protein
MPESSELDPLPILVPWRLLGSLLGAYLIAAGLLGFWVAAWADIETKRDLTRKDSLLAAQQESADARARDSLETLRRWYAYRTDSMAWEWKKSRRKVPRRRR